MSINLTILNHGVKETEFGSNDQHLMCSVFVMLFDKSRYLIELLTQNASAVVSDSVRLVYRIGSLIRDKISHRGYK